MERQRCRVLLVDDHRDTLDVLARMLTRAGYRVAAADGFTAALDAARQSPADVLVTDIELPDGNGWTLFQRLRDAHPTLRAIAISGHALGHHLQRSESLGFDAHLTKPIDLKGLCDQIDQSFSHHVPHP